MSEIMPEDLVTREEAAKAVYVTEAMVSYWTRKGRANKYFVLGNKKEFLVSMAEIVYASHWRENEIARITSGEYDSVGRMITRAEAAELLYVSEPQISNYCRRGYLTRHYLLDNKKTYFLELDEVLQVTMKRKKVEEKRVHDLKMRYWENPFPRDERGQRFVKHG
jgi:predicted transcriptional regulator